MENGEMTEILTHRVDGAGPPVLLLNGGLMSISAWNGIAERLADRHRVVRCDFRGQLLSPGDAPPELEGHVADVVEFLDHLGIACCHLIGTSFGGQVGLLLAATHPERVRSLVAATVVDYPPESMHEADERLREACREAITSGDGRPFFELITPVIYSPAYLAAHAAEMAERLRTFRAVPRAWFAGGERILAAVNAMDLRPRLGQIRCPVLVVIAEQDGLMPVERSRALAAAIPGATTVVVAGSGHALVVEARERFVELVEEFLARDGVAPGGANRYPGA
ncbi:MAG: alpha/beta hydrolase [Acidobacteriota bacterium]